MIKIFQTCGKKLQIITKIQENLKYYYQEREEKSESYKGYVFKLNWKEIKIWPRRQYFCANEKQIRKCINNVEGKYLVLAGPNFGKTFTVIQRIKICCKKVFAGKNSLFNIYYIFETSGKIDFKDIRVDDSRLYTPSARYVLSTEGSRCRLYENSKIHCGSIAGEALRQKKSLMNLNPAATFETEAGRCFYHSAYKASQREIRAQSGARL